MPRKSAKATKKGSDVYVIKSILGYEYQNGEDTYLVEWEGYPQSEATWEPKSNFFDPQADIVKKMQELKEKYEKEGTAKREKPRKVRRSGAANGTEAEKDVAKSPEVNRKRSRPSESSSGTKKAKTATPETKPKRLSTSSSSSSEESSPAAGRSPSARSRHLPRNSQNLEIVRLVRDEETQELLAVVTGADSTRFRVPIKEAREKCPQGLIDFLLKRISFRGAS